MSHPLLLDWHYKFTYLLANSADPDQKPTDLDLHCLPWNIWICINNLDQVIWLAENWKWVWHLIRIYTVQRKDISATNRTWVNIFRPSIWSDRPEQRMETHQILPFRCSKCGVWSGYPRFSTYQSGHTPFATYQSVFKQLIQ